MKTVIALIGMAGSGKSTVASALAALTGLPVRDTDREIESDEGRSIAEIFAQNGEQAFRALERKAMLCEARDCVLSLGGGAIEHRDAMAHLKEVAFVVYLRASLSAIMERVARDGARPLAPRTEELYARRAPLYEADADLTVDVDGRTVSEIASDIFLQWKNILT